MNSLNYGLLKKLCAVHAPSGNELQMTSFLLDYISMQQKNWKVQPEIWHGDGFQNCVVLIFGEPKTAVYAHIDNIGFMARYKNELIKIGSPKTSSGMKIYGADSKGEIKCNITVDDETKAIQANFNRTIDPGTDFSFDSEFRESDTYIQSRYLDNRLGVFVALKIAETLKNGVIVFSCWEEHGGGTVGYLAGILFREYGIKQSLICDITWITDGVSHGKGVAVSVRDMGIPRREYVNRIRQILDHNKIPYQVEVESSGGSDGTEIQKAPYLIDWCFVGAPEDLVHSPDEKVHKEDVVSMINAYNILMQEL